jgi:hypothetical protein
MDKQAESSIKEFDENVLKYEKFCFMSRGQEFQQDAIENLTTYKEKIIGMKEEMIKLKDEESANAMLSLEKMTKALINELKMWIALKEEEPNKALDFLIDAQNAARTAMQAHDIAKRLEDYIKKLHLLEKLLFPPQTFFSTAFIVESAKCSICGEEYGECEHVVGKAYMGKICYRLLKIKEIKEVSIVEEPADKKARVYVFSNGGVTRDYMTWRVTK